MRQWNQEKKTWNPFSRKKSIIELENSYKFLDLLKKSPLYDFGNIWITFDPNNFLEFKFVKRGNSLYFDSRILKEGKREYDFLRLLIKLSFPKLKLEPNIGIVPDPISSCSVCQIDDLVPAMVSGKPAHSTKWTCLDKRWKEKMSNSTLELWDIHFMTKYENDVHTADHKMCMINKISNGGIQRKIAWEPLYYLHTQNTFLEKYQNK